MGALSPAAATFLASALLLGPATAQGPAGLTPAEEAWLDAHGAIRVGVFPNQAPLGFFDENGAQGIPVDFCRVMDVHLGLPISFVEVTSLTDILERFQNGTLDAVGALAPTPERRAVMAFTTPYMQVETGFWVKAGTRLPEDLAGATVLVTPNSALTKPFQERFPRATLESVPGIREGLLEVQNGTADAFLHAQVAAAYEVREARLYDLTPAGPVLSVAQVAFAVRPGDAMLLAILEKGLANVPPDARLAIFQKWTGLDLSIPPPPPGLLEQPVTQAVLIGLGVGAVALLAGATAARRHARVRDARAEEAARRRELERLREMDGLKTRFINTAAHELNTPLTPIQMQLELLQRSRHGPLNEAQRRSVAILTRNFDRLAGLVHDMLESARIQAGKVQLEPRRTDLNRTVLEAIETYQEAARTAGVVLTAHVAPDLAVPADPRRVNQVLFNLVSNALKFTPRGGRVVVETERGATEAVLWVRDTGRGIAPRDLPRLFQPFVQLGEATPGAGTGLGLYICKGIVEAHGGRIWAESAGPGQGAAFAFTLPLAGPPSQPPAPDPEPAAAAAPEGAEGER